MVAATLRVAAAGREAGPPAGTGAAKTGSFLIPFLATGFAAGTAALDRSGGRAGDRAGARTGRAGCGCREETGAGRGEALDFAVREDLTFAAGGLLPDGFDLPDGTPAAGLFAAGFAFFDAGLFATRFRAACAVLGAGFTGFFLGAGAADFFAVLAADLRTGFAELRLFVACFALLPEAFTILAATHRLLAAAREPGFTSYFNVGR